MILVIDNYDSFVYNLSHYVTQLGEEIDIRRNDKITIDEIRALKPTAIIISPGPCSPQEAGISVNAVTKLGATFPILGVCLGHQAIAQAYGGQINRAEKPLHGKSNMINHDNSELFANLPNPLQVGRYHSLIADINNATDLIAIAHSESGEVMAIKHKNYPVIGVQFHPESILTPEGLFIIKNFLNIAQKWNSKTAIIDDLNNIKA